MPFAYVIEHMEEDDESSKTIPKWVELEYKHMQTLAGKEDQIHFSHVSSTSRTTLQQLFSSQSDEEQATKARADAHTIGVLDLMKESGVPLEKVCLLDPKASKELSPEDGDGRFEWFLFGGILGDDPPRDRTSELRVLGFPNRHLGPVQMTTDTALGVTKIVVEDKVALSAIKYIDYPTIVFNPKESVEMPFRYIAVNGEPLLPPGMHEHLHEDLNKSFEF
ncbi:SAM-dependent RNA methyltransferase [Abortiporus biennis]|nr:SAM-dependent RNA methyltransferase [Abortiporus biennis]